MRVPYRIRLLAALTIFCLPPCYLAAEETAVQIDKTALVYNVTDAVQRLEMAVNTSRVLALKRKIAEVQPGNQDILEMTPLSPTQVLVTAKDIGVTDVNFRDADNKSFKVSVVIFADTRELQLILQTAFPNAALKVMPIANNSVMISGYVDKVEHVERIIRIAEEYYPKVINNMTVGGVQKVLLHVQVMEVSRTKMRQLGFDWAQITGSNVITSGPSGLIRDYADDLLAIGGTGGAPAKPAIRSTGESTFAFNVVNGTSGFFGVLEALRQDNLMKIMSEPTLVAINGQVASFTSGGEIPVPEPQSLGTISVSWKKYGTQLKFVPIVLGNGNIRLEIHSQISELDYTNSVTISGNTMPALKTRDVQTAVEMTAGQTLSIAGLVQTRLEAENAGLPWISEVPYLGAAFRSVEEKRNEVELLIMVTPELVEAMDAEEAPPCGPGSRTTSPSDWELFMKGHLEVPNCCPAGGPCGGDCPPSDGMPLESIESIPAPAPADAAGRPLRGLRNANARAGNPYNRYTSPKSNSSTTPAPSRLPDGPPGLIGPAGYEAVK
ncbi:MAG: pilus assembly protein N-terminal domain-containing protein [Pirellulales bacterium]|nr:pilus assembly protein N-terminal domain-containing protein [Pirellulales bacterium]